MYNHRITFDRKTNEIVIVNGKDEVKRFGAMEASAALHECRQLQHHEAKAANPITKPGRASAYKGTK